MSGNQIETFRFEVIAVMKNAFYAKQDVILCAARSESEHSELSGDEWLAVLCGRTRRQGRPA